MPKIELTEQIGIPEDTLLEVPFGTILSAFRGSIAHGLYVPKDDPSHIDDIDIMGVCVGEEKHYMGLHEWGSRGTKENWQGHFDCVWFEARKAVSLWLQGNPNVIGMLWLRPEHYISTSPAGMRLIENRGLFVGKHVYNSFAGYASAQLQKMESRDPTELRQYMAVTAELKFRGRHPNHKGQVFSEPDRSDGEAKDVALWSEEKLLQRLKHFQKKGNNTGYLGEKRKQLVVEHGYDAKNAAHCIRLLKMGEEFLTTGEMRVYREGDRDELLAIKAGKWKLEDIKKYAEELFEEVKTARDASPLPEKPDHEAAEALLIEIILEELVKRQPCGNASTAEVN